MFCKFEGVGKLHFDLLALNGIIREDDEMNARTLARVRMPNRDGFVVMYPERAQR